MLKDRTYKLTLEEYNKLFIAFYPTLCYFAYKYTKNIEVAKDIAQEIFIKVWENKIQFESADKVKAFLYIAAKNKSLDYVKSGQNKFTERIEVFIDNIESEPHFLREVMITETTRLVENAINSLPKKCAQIIKLSLKECSNEQIAKELSLSINTIKTQKRIAYQKLRSILSAAYNFLLFLG
jgi:RNA polymerase sigma-70 factor (family 1)